MPLNNYLVVEGPDGMGKGFVVDYIADFLGKKDLNVFDIVQFQQKHGILPEFEHISQHDAFMVCEPFEGFFAYVRNELLKNIGTGRNYSGIEVAFGMAFERMVLFKKIIMPATEQGKLVVSDRSLMSLVYQMIQSEKNDEVLTYDIIMGLPGNRLAVDNPPAYALIVTCDVDVALRRKAEREKQDECGFEEREFMKQVLDGYMDPVLHDLYEENGTRIVLLDNSQDLELGQRGRIYDDVDKVLEEWLRLNGKLA